MASINDLSEPVLAHIFSNLGPRDCCAAALVNKAWRQSASDDRIWEVHCADAHSVRRPRAFDSHPLPSFMASYADWQREVGHYGSLAKRAHMAWQKIESFCRAHHPAILHTLRPGASEAELNDVEAAAKCSLPKALRVIYRFHDGQTITDTPNSALLHGLFGWFALYGSVHCTFLFPVKKLKRTCFPYKNTQLAFFAGDATTQIGLASEESGINLRARNICVDVETGVVYIVSTKQLQQNCRAVNPSDGDTVLQWFEAYADALDRQYYQVLSIGDVGLDVGDAAASGISLIPRGPPGQVEAVTRGVRVTAAVVYMPDDPLQAGGQYLFAYSIKFELLSAEEQRRTRPQSAGPFMEMTSVQLISRHWVIRNAAGHIEHVVDGEAVIGEYPHLTPGAPTFEYQSCTQQKEDEGFMEGYFTFVEGTIARPTGPEFNVQCPKFHLKIPDFIF